MVALLRILFMLAVFLAPSAALYAYKSMKAEETLPISICAQGLFLYSLSLFLPFRICAIVLFVLCGALWVYALISMLRKGIRYTLGFLSFGVIAFALITPLLYFGAVDRLFLSYDEQSHWGLITRLIDEFGELPRAGAGAEYLLFTYPPIFAIIESLFTLVFGFREGIVYFGYQVLTLALLVGLIPARARMPYKVLAFALATCVLLLFFPFAILRLFSESAMALLLALLVYYACYEHENRRFDFARTLILCMFFALCKNTAPVFVAMAIGIRLVVRPSKAEFRRCACIVLCSALAFFSYLIYCKFNGIEAAFATYFSQNIKAILTGTLDPRYASVPARFISYLFTHVFSQSGPYSTYCIATTVMVLYAGLALIALVYHFSASDKQLSKRVLIGLVVANLVYVTFLLFLYMFFFNPSEAERLSELDRYMSFMLLFTGLTLAMLIINDLVHNPSKFRTGFAVACLALCIPLSHPQLVYNTLISRENVKNTLWAREETHKTTVFLQATLPQSEQAPLIRIMGESDYMCLRYEMLPEVNFGHPHQNWFESTFAGDCDLTEQAIIDGGYNYVYVTDLNLEDERLAIDERYARLFEEGAEGILPHTLYSVALRDGKVALSRFASRPLAE